MSNLRVYEPAEEMGACAAAIYQAGERASARAVRITRASSGTPSTGRPAPSRSAPQRGGPARSRLMRCARGLVQASSSAWTIRAMALATKALSMRVGPRAPRLKVTPSR
jgi:hypothetical protein